MDPGSRVRVLPLQQRGKESVARLLDSTGTLIDELGFEQLTTQRVAKRSAVSIGLVYHYFPDRLALVQALVSRNLDRLAQAVDEMLRRPETVTWRDAWDGTVDVLVGLYHHEPGFAKVGFSDRFLASQDQADPAAAHEAAGRLLELFLRRFGRADPDAGLTGAGLTDAELTARFEVAMEVADALVSRAFRLDPAGDEGTIRHLRAVLRRDLAPR